MKFISVLSVLMFMLSSHFVLSQNSHQKEGSSSSSSACPPTDLTCVTDSLGFDAIGLLHRQIDDDQDGSLDRDESDEFYDDLTTQISSYGDNKTHLFFRDEMKYEDGSDRQATFHGSDDLITVHDLWKIWVNSEVYNWTVEDVLDWLNTDVELPQHAESFKVNIVDGHILPRIAANSQYVTNILGIKSGVHRQKLAVKATDLVLFGPPKRGHNWIKDLIVIASLLVATLGCWFAMVQRTRSHKHLAKVMKDLDNLKATETSLLHLQEQLDDAQKAKRSVAEEKQNLENKLKTEIDTAKAEADKLKMTRETTEEEMSRLKLAEEELVQVRMALYEAEKQLEDREMAPLAQLQQWLQLTYELEKRHYEHKKESAERQLTLARDMLKKMQRKQDSFLGAIRMAHSTSVDVTDQKILTTKTALESVKHDLQEKTDRWRQIEKICGFNIELNPGVQYLEALLRGPGNHLNTTQLGSGRVPGIAPPLCVEDGDEDQPPGALTSTVAFYSQSQNKSSPRDNSLLQIPGMRHNPSAHHIWPGLMRAGMQLTMVGVNMNNQRIAGGHHYDSLRLRGAGPSLSQALGGSTSSINTLPGRVRTNPGPLYAPTPTTDSDNVSEAEDGMSPLKNGGVASVQFNLGEQDGQEQINNNAHPGIVEFGKGKSLSMDSASMKTAAARPRTLKTTKSDSNIGLTHNQSLGTPSSLSRVTPTSLSSRSRGTPTPQEDGSSPESTDSASLQATLPKQKKKKRKLLGLLKPSRS